MLLGSHAGAPFILIGLRLARRCKCRSARIGQQHGVVNIRDSLQQQGQIAFYLHSSHPDPAWLQSEDAEVAASNDATPLGAFSDSADISQPDRYWLSLCLECCPSAPNIDAKKCQKVQEAYMLSSLLVCMLISSPARTLGIQTAAFSLVSQSSFEAV